MKELSKKLIIATITSIINVMLFSINVFAIEEDIKNIAVNQAEQPNAGQVYVNEPLDNAIPVIYKYEIFNEDEPIDSIIPGDDFILRFTVYNPAVVSKVGNIRIIISQSDNLIYPQYGRTNEVYIGYLEPLAYAEGKIRLTAAKEINTEQISLNLQMSYTDNFYTNNTQQLLATLPVSSSGTLTLSGVDIPSNMIVGANNRLSISYQNNGLSGVNDAILYMTGDTIEEQQVPLGSISSGSSNTSDVYLQLKESGTQTIAMHFTYADSDGVVHETEIQEYTISASSSTNQNSNESIYENNRNRINLYITILALALSIIIITVFTLRATGKFKPNKKMVKDKKS